MDAMEEKRIYVSTETLLTEGKTKKIWDFLPQVARIESKPDITAGDGQRHDVIPGKDRLANLTTCYIFQFLKKKGIPTHFITVVDKPDQQDKINSFLAYQCQMIPLEIVVRRHADGSILKREKNIRQGQSFFPLLVEFYYKKNELRDPLIYPDPCISPNKWHLVSAQNLKEKIGEIKPLFPPEQLARIRALSLRTFSLLEEEFTSGQLTLWDLKLEFGYSPENEIVLADVIDADSWRLTDEKGRQLSKQPYRDGANPAEMLKIYTEIEAICRRLFATEKT